MTGGMDTVAHTVELNPNGLKPIRTVDERLVSYNIEMTEVTGGTFWKAYTPGQIAGTEEFPPMSARQPQGHYRHG